MCLCHMNMVNLFLSTFFTPVTINIEYIELSMVVLIFAPIFKEIFLKQVIDFFNPLKLVYPKKEKIFQNLLLYSCVNKNIKFVKRKENHSVEKFKTFNKRIVQRII